METKICKVCGKELPIDRFQRCKGGHCLSTCKECFGKRISEARKGRSQASGGDGYRDPDFDGKTPREVQDILARAARWLNNYGGFTCEVSLRYEKEIALPIR